MTKNRTPTPVYLDPGMHPGLEVKGLMKTFGEAGIRTWLQATLESNEPAYNDVAIKKKQFHPSERA